MLSVRCLTQHPIYLAARPAEAKAKEETIIPTNKSKLQQREIQFQMMPNNDKKQCNNIIPIPPASFPIQNNNNLDTNPQAKTNTDTQTQRLIQYQIT